MFNFQGTHYRPSRDSLYIISHLFLFVNTFLKIFFRNFCDFCSPLLGELVYYITYAPLCQHLFCVSTKMSFYFHFFQPMLSILNIKGYYPLDNTLYILCFFPESDCRNQICHKCYSQRSDCIINKRISCRLNFKGADCPFQSIHKRNRNIKLGLEIYNNRKY